MIDGPLSRSHVNKLPALLTVQNAGKVIRPVNVRIVIGL
jgi:hypothetical protein